MLPLSRREIHRTAWHFRGWLFVLQRVQAGPKARGISVSEGFLARADLEEVVGVAEARRIKNWEAGSRGIPLDARISTVSVADRRRAGDEARA